MDRFPVADLSVSQRGLALIAEFIPSPAPRVQTAERTIRQHVGEKMGRCEFDALVAILLARGAGQAAAEGSAGVDGIIIKANGEPSNLLACIRVGNFGLAAENFSSWRGPGLPNELDLTRQCIAFELHFRDLPWKRALKALTKLPADPIALRKLALDEAVEAEAARPRPAPRPAPKFVGGQPLPQPVAREAADPAIGGRIVFAGGDTPYPKPVLKVADLPAVKPPGFFAARKPKVDAETWDNQVATLVANGVVKPLEESDRVAAVALKMVGVWLQVQAKRSPGYAMAADMAFGFLGDPVVFAGLASGGTWLAGVALEALGDRKRREHAATATTLLA